jgi:hypothetical protein
MKKMYTHKGFSLSLYIFFNLLANKMIKPVKQFILLFIAASVAVGSFAQETGRKDRKSEKKENKRKKIDNIVRQEEEGVLVYRKQNIFGFELRTNGYGAFYELGRMKTARKTTIYHIGISEIKNIKEEKFPSGGIIFGGTPFVYGKINNFYQFKLGFGQQYILGQKGNRNGVAVAAVGHGGLSLGLLRPYYLEVEGNGGSTKFIKYDDDTTVFLNGPIYGGGGLGKGWSELKIKPGVYAKTGLRFDIGRFNEVVTAIEAGVSAEYYFSKIPIMAKQPEKNLFFQGYVAIEFGRRK